MSGKYKAVGWNRQKRFYDATMLVTLSAVIGLYAVLSATGDPAFPAETVLLRGTALGAVLLLHVILCIGPLARLNTRFLPLLYNRRHLGVTMCVLATVHAAFAVVYYHALGVANPLVGAFTAYGSDYNLFREAGGLAHLPFEPFGAVAWVIVFLMAATSHDFWLRVLGASFWKSLHVLVYVAYGSVVVHVALGVLQDERSPVPAALLCAGLAVVLGLHLAAQQKEVRIDRRRANAEADGFIFACDVADLCDGHGRAVRIGDERRAVFRHGDRVYALSNVCRHQGGPIGEGRILDGCITCPWHGWQYRPDTGTSPPPFHEVISTYPVRIVDGKVFVKPEANPPESRCEGAAIESSESSE